MECDWTLIIFQNKLCLTLPHVNFVFKKKKKKIFFVCFNTNNLEFFSCQPCVTCVSHVELKKFFLSSHVLTFNFNFNLNRHAWMWYKCWYHLTTREEIGFTSKTCLAWQNSSIFLLSEKMVEKNGFTTTYPLSINFKFSLKPEIGCKFVTKWRR